MVKIQVIMKNVTKENKQYMLGDIVKRCQQGFW